MVSEQKVVFFKWLTERRRVARRPPTAHAARLIRAQESVRFLSS
jgi:hypothetical protein